MAGHTRSSAFSQGAIVVRDQRHHQVRPVASPVCSSTRTCESCEARISPCIIGMSCAVPQRPAVPQHDVVHILKPDSGGLADEIDGVEQVLDADHFQSPRPLLFTDHFTQRGGRGAMAAAGIDIDQGDVRASQFTPPFLSTFDVPRGLRFRFSFSAWAAGDSGSSCTARFHSRTALPSWPCARRASPSFQWASAAGG